jgi:hypothetical protein
MFGKEMEEFRGLETHLDIFEDHEWSIHSLDGTVVCTNVELSTATRWNRHDTVRNDDLKLAWRLKSQRGRWWEKKKQKKQVFDDQKNIFPQKNTKSGSVTFQIASIDMEKNSGFVFITHPSGDGRD